ncbi:MAG: hypothetical protein WD472_12460 [Dehalococcoidia bacterium]
MRFRQVAILAVYAGLLLIAGVACSGSSDQTSDDPTDYEVREVPARWSTAQASDLRTLVSSSDVVFVGTVVTRAGQADAPLGPTSSGEAAQFAQQPVTRQAGFPVSKFDVEVTKAIVGALTEGDALVIEQPGGFVSGADGVRSLLVLEGDQPLEPGVSYLIFATLKPNGAYASAPYARMRIAHNDVSAGETWRHLPAVAQLEGQRLDQAIAEISDAR